MLLVLVVFVRLVLVLLVLVELVVVATSSSGGLEVYQSLRGAGIQPAALQLGRKSSQYQHCF